jgi:NIPSNAP
MNAALAHADCCAVVELRQYTLKPGQRDILIDLFERHFIESQEAAGMTLVGQFRDRRRDDRFVWLRGFANMEARHKASKASTAARCGRRIEMRRMPRCWRPTTYCY